MLSRPRRHFLTFSSHFILVIVWSCKKHNVQRHPNVFSLQLRAAQYARCAQCDHDEVSSYGACILAQKGWTRHNTHQTTRGFKLLCRGVEWIEKLQITYWGRDREKERALCSLISCWHCSSGLCGVGNNGTQPSSLTLCLAWSSRVLEKGFQHDSVCVFLCVCVTLSKRVCFSISSSPSVQSSCCQDASGD